ncbi:MAG TPA: hypothetical protein VI356_22925 [Myxococcales bacterium]
MLASASASCSGGSSASPSKPEAPLAPLPPPTLSVVSSGVQFAGEPLVLDLYGQYFHYPSGTPGAGADTPAVTLSRVRDLDGNAVNGPDDHPSVAVLDGHGGATLATAMSSSILPPGVYSVTLRTAAGLEVGKQDGFVVLPQPSLSSLDPEIVCDPGTFDRSGSARPLIGINGANLYRLHPFDPGVRLGIVRPDGTTFSGFTAVPEAFSGCRTVPFAGDQCFLTVFGLGCNHFDSVQLCDRIEARLPQDIRNPSAMTLSVDLPLRPTTAPALSHEMFLERSVPPPPGILYSAVNGAVEVPISFGPSAAGPRAAPAATLDGAAFPVTPADCVASGADGIDLCQRLSVVLPQGFPPGDHALTLETAGACTGSMTIHLAPKPVIHTATPPSICKDTRQQIVLSGDGLSGRDVSIDGALWSVVVGCDPLQGDSSCREVVFQGGELALGPHRMQIETFSIPHLSSDPIGFDVVPGPPFHGPPKPGLVFASGQRQVFIALSNVTGHIRSARLLPLGPGTPIPAPIVEVAGGAEVTVPAEAGTGIYAIEISDDGICAGGEIFEGNFLQTTDNPIVFQQDYETPDSLNTLQALTAAGGQGPALVWLPNQGSTGSAVGATTDAGAPDWYYDTFGWAEDVGLLRFDLRAIGSGDPASSPGVVLSNVSFTLEHAIPSPPADGTWAHYELALQNPDGWTYRDAQQSRPATLDDLRVGSFQIRVLGSWWTGGGSSALDNFATELAR